jgi:hypothetical protein
MYKFILNAYAYYKVMSEKVDIHPYVNGDEEGIVSLLETVFEGWPHFDLQCSPLDHWRWKYQDNPLKMKAVTIWKSNNRIIGCSHGFYLKLKIGEKILLAEQGTDLAIHKDFRGMGIYKKMVNLKNETHRKFNTNIIYTISGNPIVIRNDLKNNRPQFPSPIRHLIKIRDIDLHLRMKKSKNRLIKKYGYLILKILNQINNISTILDNYNGSKQNFEISEIEKFDKHIETFWNEIKDNYSFIVERNESYLNWRYCDKRGGDYVIKQVYESGTVIGYIVLRINKYDKEYSEGYIVDVLTLPDRIDAAKALFLNADRFFAEQNVNIIHTLAIKGHPYERLFNRNNYLSDRRRYYLFYTPLNVGNELNDFTSAPRSRLHFMYGDLDWI